MADDQDQPFSAGQTQDQAIPDNTDQGIAPPRSLMGDIGNVAQGVGGAISNAYSAVKGGMESAGQSIEGARADIHGYLMGRNAVDQKTWDTMGGAVDPDGRMQPSERNHYIVSAAQQKDPMDLGPSAVEYARKQYSVLNAAAASALHQGNLQSATQRATEAHNFVLDGSNTTFQAGNDGQIRATVTPFNGKPNQYVLSPSQFNQLVHGPQSMWDHVVEKNADQVISRIVSSGGEMQQGTPQGGGPFAGAAEAPQAPQGGGQSAGTPAAAATAVRPSAGTSARRTAASSTSTGTPAIFTPPSDGANAGSAQNGSYSGGGGQENKLTFADPIQTVKDYLERFGNHFGIRYKPTGNADVRGMDPNIQRLVQQAYPDDPTEQAKAYITLRNQSQEQANKLQVAQSHGIGAANIHAGAAIQGANIRAGAGIQEALIRAEAVRSGTDDRETGARARDAANIFVTEMKNPGSLEASLKGRSPEQQKFIMDLLKGPQRKPAPQGGAPQTAPQPQQGVGAAPQVQAPQIRHDPATGQNFIQGPDGKPVPYQPGQ